MMRNKIFDTLPYLRAGVYFFPFLYSVTRVILELSQSNDTRLLLEAASSIYCVKRENMMRE